MTALALLTLLVFALVAPQAMAADACAALPEGHLAAVEALAGSDEKGAITAAERARDLSPQCAEAHLAYAMALNKRLQASRGLTALGVSRDYRAALDRALELDPASVRARTELIQFLIHAPAIAGGNADRARREIVALASSHPLEAARLSLAVERRGGSDLAVLAALERVADLAPGDAHSGLDLATRLIRLERYTEADRRLAALSEAVAHTEERTRLAIPFLRGRLRLLGGFETAAAVTFLRAYLDAGGPAGDDSLPSRALGLYRLGEAQEKNGACHEAARSFADAHALDATVDGLAVARTRVAGCS